MRIKWNLRWDKDRLKKIRGVMHLEKFNIAKSSLIWDLRLDWMTDWDMMISIYVKL